MKKNAGSRAHYAANKEAINEKRRVKRANDKEVLTPEELEIKRLEKNAYCRDRYPAYKETRTSYYDANKEAINKRNRDYLKTPKGKLASKAGNHRRRALKQAAEGTLSPADIATIFNKPVLLCDYCERLINHGEGKERLEATVDHVVPLSKGGRNDLSNAVPSCKSCNSRKHNKSAEDFKLLIRHQHVRQTLHSESGVHASTGQNAW